MTNGTKYTYKIDMESLNAMADLASKTGQDESSRISEKEYCGQASFDDAIRYARSGWSEGADKAKRLMERMQLDFPLPERFVPTEVYDVVGAYVDIGAYMDGVPECMVDFQPDMRPARFARIVSSCSFSGAIGAPAAMARGVAVAAVVDRFESQGVRCEVVAQSLIKGSDGNSTCLFTLPLKEAHQALNLESVAFALGHPAFLRRLLFGVREMQSQKFRDAMGISLWGGYGLSMPLPKEPGTLLFDTMKIEERWSESNAFERIVTRANAWAQDNDPNNGSTF